VVAVPVPVVGTLLGPEGTGDRCLVPGPVCISYRRGSPVGGAGLVGSGGRGFWLVVENCTVDASIF
jgi:hypothetical protein